MDEPALRKVLAKLNIHVVNKSGKWLEFSCPYAHWTHRKKTDNSASAAAVIDLEKPSNYKCHACKKHGRISSLVRTLEHYRGEKYKGLAFEADLADAVHAYGNFESQEEEIDELPPALNEAAYADLFDPAWDFEEARLYLKNQRNISKETAKGLRLGYDPEEMRITFPVRHLDGQLYGFTGRSILKDKDFPYKKYKKVRDYNGLPKRHLLLGAHRVQKNDLPLFVGEGLFGYAHCFEINAHDIVNPLALLGSEMTQFKAEHIIGLDRLTVLLPDNDEAGDSCLFGAFNTFNNAFEGNGAVDKLQAHVPLIIPEWPKRKNDIDQLTIDEVSEMVYNTPLWAVKNKGKKNLR